MTRFAQINLKPLSGLIIGVFSGYIHWYFWGCYWGTYPMSSECWVNMSYGALFGGYLATLIYVPKQTKVTSL